MLIQLSFFGIESGGEDSNATFKITGRFIDTRTPYLALSLASILYVTLAITYRIWSLTSKNASVRESGFTYSNVIQAVVESALLYSVSLVIMFPLIVRKNPLYRYMQDIVAQIVVRARVINISAATVPDTRLGYSAYSDPCPDLLGTFRFHRLLGKEP